MSISGPQRAEGADEGAQRDGLARAGDHIWPAGSGRAEKPQKMQRPALRVPAPASPSVPRFRVQDLHHVLCQIVLLDTVHMVEFMPHDLTYRSAHAHVVGAGGTSQLHGFVVEGIEEGDASQTYCCQFIIPSACPDPSPSLSPRCFLHPRKTPVPSGMTWL